MNINHMLMNDMFINYIKDIFGDMVWGVGLFVQALGCKEKSRHLVMVKWPAVRPSDPDRVSWHEQVDMFNHRIANAIALHL